MKHLQTGASRTWAIAGMILGGVTLWMLTGLLRSNDTHAETVPATVAAPVFTVSAREQKAETVTREVLVNGDTRPDQIVDVASQVEGQVIAIGARKGARVKQGELLARIDPRDLEQHRLRAAALLRQRELEHAAAMRLRETGYVTEGELAGKFAALEIARADVKDIELRLANLQIVAPVGGILEVQHMEVGDYAKVGQPVAQLIKTDPLLISGGVSENDIRYVRTGNAARARILDGTQLDGRVSFVSAMADAKTRTFTVEVEVANPGARIPAGLSAKVVIPAESVSAHRIPASLMSLADDGTIGVKHLVGGKVVFTPAQIVRADGDAVHVAGLPASILLITRGQAFVVAGETVNVEGVAAQSAAGSR